MQLLVFVVHFLNAFWHGKETFPKSSSQNEVVPLLIVFHLPYSKYKGAKICFYSFRYKIKIFHSCRTRVVRLALVSHSCHQCITRVALVSHSCHQCLILVASVALVSHSCRSCLALVLQIRLDHRVNHVLFKFVFALFRSSHRRCFIKNAVFAIFTWKHPCWSLFLIMLQAFRSATLLKGDCLL